MRLSTGTLLYLSCKRAVRIIFLHQIALVLWEFVQAVTDGLCCQQLCILQQVFCGVAGCIIVLIQHIEVYTIRN